MKVGIIGCGGIAHVHGPLIMQQSGAQIVGVADKDRSRAELLASQLRVKKVYQDAEAMIHEQKPDVVHVLVPPQYHEDVSVMALNHSCHVLVEKPMALTLADAEKNGEGRQKEKCALVC